MLLADKLSIDNNLLKVKNEVMQRNYIVILLGLSLLILGFSIGFFVSRVLLPVNSTGTLLEDSQNADGDRNNEDNLYSSQIATIRGTIIQTDNRLLTIKNINNNVVGTREASNRILIAKVNSKTPTSDLSSIELNKEALITLEKAGANYIVTQIQYILPAPSLPPITATINPSATPPANPQPSSPNP